MLYTKNNYSTMLILMLFAACSFESYARPMGSSHAGVRVKESPTVEKKRKHGLAIKQEERIKERRGLQADKKEQPDNPLRQNQRQGVLKKRPGQAYSVIENGVTVRKRYPLNSSVEPPEDASKKLTPKQSKTLIEAEKYAKLTPWFRAKLEGTKLPVKQNKNKAITKKANVSPPPEAAANNPSKPKSPPAPTDGTAKSQEL
jgi:hypothetical protein